MIFLNLGCDGGTLIKRPGWVNVGLFPDHNPKLENLPYRIQHQDLMGKMNWLENDTVDGIFASHILEHFMNWKAKEILSDCLRVLKPGGTIRVSVPHLRIMAQKYLENNHEYYVNRLNKDYMEARWGATASGGFVGCLYWEEGTGQYHRYAYDFTIMERTLKQVGFKDIVESKFRQSSLEEFRYNDVDNREDISLFVEAKK